MIELKKGRGKGKYHMPLSLVVQAIFLLSKDGEQFFHFFSFLLWYWNHFTIFLSVQIKMRRVLLKTDKNAMCIDKDDSRGIPMVNICEDTCKGYHNY